MIDKVEKSMCTGCAGCKNICPVSAITFRADSEGFEYPDIDMAKCIKCNLCEKICPILHPVKSDNTSKPDIYAAWNMDENIRINSTSGGIFSALATQFIQRGGLVVGAVYLEDFSIVHTMISSIHDLEKLRQSKYAQSKIQDIFKSIKDELSKGNKVLFCGSPCQNAGLRNFLRKDYENLYCCDFICRGIISQKVYHKFLNDVSKKHSSDIKNIQFKNKDFGWNRFSTKVSYKDGSVYQLDRFTDYYMVGYLKHNLYLRPSCHNCHFKSLPRVADISLGDFWGIANFDANLDNNKGTSVVIVNSQKGRELYSWIKNDVYSCERTLDEVTKGNSCLLNCAPAGKYREYFFKNIDKTDFIDLINKIDKKASKVPMGEKAREYITVVKNHLKR